MIRGLAIALVCLAGFAQAETLAFPSNASLQRTVSSPVGSHIFPVGIWDRGEMPTRLVEGQLTQQAWRIAAPSLTTLQLVRPLREQLRNNRYRIIFECQTEACGGFDFRFAIDALPPPEMQVNIGDFRFLAAERATPEGPEVLSLLVSRTAQAGFVQLTHVSPFQQGAAQELAAPQAPEPVAGNLQTELDLQDQLESAGRAVLADLTFATGSAQLAQGEYASLRELADYLEMFPDRTVALVGHTDAEGDLSLNIALSKRRAASVLERMVATYGTPRRQLDAQGVGYLAPLQSNQTEGGRNLNRRVEVVISSTEN